jgi:hypothetical protein
LSRIGLLDLDTVSVGIGITEDQQSFLLRSLGAELALSEAERVASDSNIPFQVMMHSRISWRQNETEFAIGSIEAARVRFDVLGCK